jgi:DNA replication and repair protein RecF
VRLAWVELRDFRNHRETRLDVPAGVVVVLGPNGEGKTNLLEGMYYLVDLTSPRAASDLPLVRDGAESAFVRGEVETRDGRVLVEVEVRRSGANRVQVNRTSVRRRRDLRRRVRGVFYSPDDLVIGQGDPDRRRRFMDQAVTSLWPPRESVARSYEKALRQRNRLLKDWEPGGQGSAPPGLEVWDVELALTGSALTRVRNEAVARVAGPAGEEFLALTGYELEVMYRPSVPVTDGADASELEDAFRARLAERRADDLARRTSLVGPHRDELDLRVRDLSLRGFASHGESWAASLALRLGLARAVADEVGEPPILFLDDPFSGLDPVRRQRLGARLEGRGQVMVSVADPGQTPAGVSAVWEVKAGEVAPAEHPGVRLTGSGGTGTRDRDPEMGDAGP